MLGAPFQKLMAQPAPVSGLTAKEIEEYQQQVRGMVSFFQFLCNAIGDSESTPKEKDIVISQTYLKAFRDENVQVEDDLVENRRTVTNKNVQAYLKDIEFFFREARFEYHIESLEHYLTDGGAFYFKVSTTRNLQATTIDGKIINVSQPRFFEINLNEAKRDLKIVSIYTTKVSEAEALTNWWNELSTEWQYLLGKELRLTDSLTVRQLMEQYGAARLRDTLLLPVQPYTGTGFTQVSDLSIPNSSLTRYDTLFLNKPDLYQQLRSLVERETLSIAGDPALTDLAAIGRFTQLRRLDISGTRINDLQALRNLTRLEYFDCSGTPVSSIAALRYATQLRHLRCADTRLATLDAVENFIHLETLDCSGSPISDLTLLADIQSLREASFSRSNIKDLAPLSGKMALIALDISGTKVDDLSPLSDLPSLHTLNITGTRVRSLAPLASTPALSTLISDRTALRDLTPLINLPRLERVYCDETAIDASIVIPFIEQRPTVLIVYQTDRLQKWWGKLPDPWREVFSRYLPQDAPVDRDALQQIANLRAIDIRGATAIVDLEPITVLSHLRELRCSHSVVRSLAPLAGLKYMTLLECSHTPITDLLPLMDLTNLKVLDIRHTDITDLTPLAYTSALTWLNCDYTPVSSLEPLANLSQLDTVYCDNTQVNIAEVRRSNMRALVIFQTVDLEQWWADLPVHWQTVFREHVRMDRQPTREQLNAVAGLHTLNISGNREITELKPLERLYRLQQLSIEDTRITSLMPVSRLSTLTVLKCARSPVQDLGPLRFHTGLRELNIENTPVANLEPLANLLEIEQLICAGTQIKDLRPISNMRKLRNLDISNTEVRTLKPLEGLPGLESLSCFNTRISARQVESMRQSMPAMSIVHY